MHLASTGNEPLITIIVYITVDQMNWGVVAAPTIRRTTRLDSKVPTSHRNHLDSLHKRDTRRAHQDRLLGIASFSSK